MYYAEFVRHYPQTVNVYLLVGAILKTIGSACIAYLDYSETTFHNVLKVKEATISSYGMSTDEYDGTGFEMSNIDTEKNNLLVGRSQPNKYEVMVALWLSLYIT